MPKDLNFEPRKRRVKLPSKGKIYFEDHPYCNKGEVEVFCMSGKHEDILSNEDYLRNNTVIMKLLEAIIVEDFNPGLLLTGDASSILYAHRITGFGPEVEMQVNCRNCGNSEEIKIDINKFEINSLEVEPIEENKNEFEIEYKYDGVASEYHGNYEFRFKFLRYKDTEDIRLSNEKKAQYGIESKEGTYSNILKHSLISINGDKTKVDNFVDNAPADFVNGVRSKIQDLTPKVNDTYEYICSNCRMRQLLMVVTDPNFFWPNRPR